MNLLRLLTKLWTGDPDDKSVTLDHVPVSRKKRKDWRTKALKEASQKYGKPFKVGPDNLPHEVMGRSSDNVQPIKRRA